MELKTYETGYTLATRDHLRRLHRMAKRLTADGQWLNIPATDAECMSAALDEEAERLYYKPDVVRNARTSTCAGCTWYRFTGTEYRGPEIGVDGSDDTDPVRENGAG